MPGTRSKRRHILRLWLILAAILLLSCGTALLAILFIDRHIGRWARPRIYRNIGDVPQCEAALVLGARVYSSGRLSAMLEDRVFSAVQLYKAGKVKKLLLSGDNSTRNCDEVTAMRRRAIELGAKSDDVVRDFAGFRTYDSIYRARELWDLRSMVIVTQQFHLPRALYIADALGIDATGYVADRRAYGASHTRSRVREIFSRAFAWLDVHVLDTKPHFLGPKESLSGNRQEQQQQRRRGDRTP